MKLARRVVWEARRYNAFASFRYTLRCTGQSVEPNIKTALIVAPHPDDETLGCGGLIALKRAMHATVAVVFLTDGSRSHGPCPPMGTDQLIAARKQEATAAMDVLGVAPSELHFLDFPDGELGRLPSDLELALLDRLTKIIQKYRPAEIYVTHGCDRLPDHEAGYRLTREASNSSGVESRLVQYPMWMMWLGIFGLGLRRGDLVGARRVAIRSVLHKKRQAIQRYRSQHETLPTGFVARFLLPYEVFFDAAEASGSPANDGAKTFVAQRRN